MHDMHLVFVYGSLKRNFGNHRVLDYNGAEFVSEAVTKDMRYTMIDLGYFPGVVAQGETAIHGELFLVDGQGLEACDRLEGHPKFYRRERVELELDSGEPMVAWMYMLPGFRYHNPGKTTHIKRYTLDGKQVATWTQK